MDHIITGQEPEVISRSRRSLPLILHCGAREVKREELDITVLPPRTKTWTPVDHGALLKSVEEALFNVNLKIMGEAHGLTPDGMRYFGLLEVQRDTGNMNPDYTWMVGLRNSHDKTFPAGLVAGMQVFCCDNLSFNGTVKLARKHTTHILRDLPTLTQNAVGKLADLWLTQDKRIVQYKDHDLDDRAAHDLLVRALDAKVLLPSVLPVALEAWRKPAFESFEPRNMWSLFNACTSALKTGAAIPERTERLHGLFDNFLSA